MQELSTAAWIGLWAWLFCRPLSEPGEVLGGVKNLLYKLNTPDWLMKILIDCPKCHAGQVAYWVQVWAWFKTGFFSIPFIITAITTAIIITSTSEAFDKWQNR